MEIFPELQQGHQEPCRLRCHMWTRVALWSKSNADQD